jgi:hypothetical protein
MVKVVRSNRTTLRICLDLVGLLLGILTYRYFDLNWGVALVSFFGTFAIFQFFMPHLIHRRVYYRNPRLFGMRTVTFNDDGLKSDSEIAHTEIKWSSFEKFKETNNLFLTYQTRDVAGIVPKRAFPSREAVAQFRDYLLASKVRRG